MTLDTRRAAELIGWFRNKRVLVVGDVMLDEFIRGDVTRISPEAPVPVVDLRDRLATAGGAGNAAANVVSLGGQATIVALIGRDGVGAMLRDALGARGIDTSSLVASAERPTTHKLRVIAHAQQIVRVDAETRAPLGPELEREIVDVAGRVADTADAALVSDYAKGVVSDTVARAVIARAAKNGLPVVVDPKGRRWEKYVGATVITPNVLELDDVSGVHTENADESIVDAGGRVLASLDGASLLVTRGARGMTLLRQGSAALHLPTLARSVYDVTGAGDTVVGALALALAARVPIEDALVLASHAARIAVSKVGTTAVSAEELLASWSAAE